jgi:hypothetical protein
MGWQARTETSVSKAVNVSRARGPFELTEEIVMGKSLPFVLALLIAMPALASSPGEPLDCSDWVFLEPGLSCGNFHAYPSYVIGLGPYRVFDNKRNLYRLRDVPMMPCGATAPSRVEIQRTTTGMEWSTVAYIESRCNDPASSNVDGVYSNNGLLFDPPTGRLLADLTLSGGSMYDTAGWVPVISGFATLFDILQTYESTAGPISFRVPDMPEGFQYADHFDTYYGDLATVGDWSQAKPLQCDYPASPPAVGDYLTVEDMSPPLESGQGRYYVTAVTYQGQTRYGRKSSGGVLTGRDPAVLPVCDQ